MGKRGRIKGNGEDWGKLAGSVWAMADGDRTFIRLSSSSSSGGTVGSDEIGGGGGEDSGLEGDGVGDGGDETTPFDREDRAR